MRRAGQIALRAPRVDDGELFHLRGIVPSV